MNYEETIQYLYNSTPLFQHHGNSAYKEGLGTTRILDKHFGHPHTFYRTIHIAGTNGKGSCAHTIAAILQSAGYKVGLYTSPHLNDFRERIRINGIMIPKDYVVDFVQNEKSFFEPLSPSFFELTTALAFKYFKDEGIDVAVVEVGLGGRLDCTNIINPDISIITNIGFDHTQFLGNTLAKIASEKAGIIKRNIPVIIGEHTAETKIVFEQKASAMCSPILFASDNPIVIYSELANDKISGRLYHIRDFGILYGELSGIYQEKNTNTILYAIQILRKQGYDIAEKAIRKGFSEVCELTHLQGRWQILKEKPLIICDTAHNVDGFKMIIRQLKLSHYDKLHVIIGMVKDKDINGVLQLLPTDAEYYFTQASVERSFPANELKILASKFHLKGDSYETVSEAYIEAQKKTDPNDLIYIGGSNFIVADFLKNF